VRSAAHLAATAPAIVGSFDEVVLPHLDAAHRLARWLVRNEDDAEDVVQEASLRALRYFRTFTGGNGRAWFLRIVRNTCWDWRGRKASALTDLFDEQQHSSITSPLDPEAVLLRTDGETLIAQAMRNLPERFRVLLVLRELEGLSYRELADAMGIPMGTVMSGLSRARHALRSALKDETGRRRISRGCVLERVGLARGNGGVLAMPQARNVADAIADEEHQ
jgi:RNA polymerase sigma-70 factor, ECF subfamily